MPYTSFENDAAKDFKVYASLSDDVPLTTVNAYGASWAIEVSNAGSTGLKVTSWTARTRPYHQQIGSWGSPSLFRRRR